MSNENHTSMILVTNLTVKRNDQVILSDISFSLGANEHLAIIGNAASGKTTLGKAIANKIFFEGKVNFFLPQLPKIVFIEQQHGLKNKVNTTDMYYQQRFNSFDAEDTITVHEYFLNHQRALEIIGELNLEYLLHRPLIQLSNGENKKIQLAKHLSENPDIIILDNPFLGLDIDTRKFLNLYLNKLSKEGKICILITSPLEIPDFINRVLELRAGKMMFFETRQNYIYQQSKKQFNTPIHNKPIPTNHLYIYDDFSHAVDMKDVNIKYGEVKLLEQINWTIKRGERWHLKGHNGAGKSTLLSLITGDNPQAYAINLSLFDRRRGTGESIWDIKKKIGFLSPELHLYYEKTTTFSNTIGSGFFDSIGLFQKLTESQQNLVDEWIECIGCKNLKDKYLYELSISQQRMALLTRAFIKNPPLLILDEPCQGLDQIQKKDMLELIDAVCQDPAKTLIYVSHYDDEIPRCITKSLHLKEGKLEMVE